LHHLRFEARRAVAQRLGQVTFGIHLDGEDPAAAPGAEKGQGRGDGGLATAALAGDEEDSPLQEVVKVNAPTGACRGGQDASAAAGAGFDGGG
jgi:hypothetical protein